MKNRRAMNMPKNIFLRDVVFNWFD